MMHTGPHGHIPVRRNDEIKLGQLVAAKACVLFGGVLRQHRQHITQKITVSRGARHHDRAAVGLLDLIKSFFQTKPSIH